MLGGMVAEQVILFKTQNLNKQTNKRTQNFNSVFMCLEHQGERDIAG